MVKSGIYLKFQKYVRIIISPLPRPSTYGWKCVTDLKSYDVDFATWWSYKHLNSGPGGVSGIYVNSRHINNDITGLGWWVINYLQGLRC